MDSHCPSCEVLIPNDGIQASHMSRALYCLVQRTPFLLYVMSVELYPDQSCQLGPRPSKWDENLYLGKVALPYLAQHRPTDACRCKRPLVGFCQPPILWWNLVPEEEIFFLRLHSCSVAEPLLEHKCLDFCCRDLPITTLFLSQEGIFYIWKMISTATVPSPWPEGLTFSFWWL